MDITLYYMDKRLNSTKNDINPDGTILIGYAAKGQMCEPYSVLAPVFSFSGSVIQKRIPDYNYIKLEPSVDNDRARYYWVREWAYNSGLWYATCTLDVLGTYKREIGNYTTMILRSESIHNVYIPDGNTNMLCTASYDFRRPITTPAYQNQDVSFVFTICGGVDGGTGVQQYVVDAATASTILYYMMSSVDYMDINISEVSANLQKALINPAQYISKIQMFPLRLNTSSHHGQIKFGWWNLPVQINYSLLSDNNYADATQVYAFSLPVPKHPDSGADGNPTDYGLWLNGAPYSNYTLVCYPWGTLSLDGQKMLSYDRIQCVYHVDLMDGTAVLFVWGVHETETSLIRGSLIATATCNFAVDIPITQIAVDPGKLQAGVYSGVAGAVSSIAHDVDNVAGNTKTSKLGNFLGGLISQRNKAQAASGQVMGVPVSSVFGEQVAEATAAPEGNIIDIDNLKAGILNGINGALQSVEMRGGLGGMTKFNIDVMLVNHYYQPAPLDHADIGYPSMSIRRIGDLSGFVKCQCGDIKIGTATASELNTIKAYLEGGFFYE